MRIDVLTLFPEMCEAVLSSSIIGRAREAKKLEINCHNIRDYTVDKHRRVDDYPYGGGKGMIMHVQPIDSCFNAVCEAIGEKPHFIFMTPQGKPLTQGRAVELSRLSNISILCGHYEGVDERVIEKLCDEEISIGDYVLTGGELPALVLIDTVCRLVDGVLAEKGSFEEESHFGGLLEYPQYTRPPVWEDREVPPVLISGHHANIVDWQRKQMLKRTAEKRPELLEKAELSEKEREYLKNISENNG